MRGRAIYQVPPAAFDVTMQISKRDDFFRYARVAAADATGRSRLALMLFAQGEQMPEASSLTLREFLTNRA